MSDSVNQATNSGRRGAVAVISRDERLLVIRRSQHVAAPGAYCFPGGAIEAGETDTEALIRELHEELNVAVTPLRKVWDSVTPWGVELVWWLSDLALDAQPVPEPSEVESVHWHTLQEIVLLPELLEGNRQFVAALARGDVVLNR